MSTDQSRFVPVNTTVLLQTLVEAVNEQVQERRASRALIKTPPALEADHSLIGDNEPSLDRALRVCGYLARVLEVEMFEPAQRVADWVSDSIAPHLARAGNEDEAVAALCGVLAQAEPIEKPDPDDPAAMSWRVPGPGGHVRHYVARRAIEECLRGRDKPIEGAPEDLKRAWMYGFFVRTCEEALADDAEGEPEGQPEAKPKGEPQGQPEAKPKGEPQGQPEAKPKGEPDGS